MPEEQKPVVADWPEEPGLYKVVQIFVGEDPYLRFSQTTALDSDQEFHGDMLKRFLVINGLPFETFGSKDIPKSKGNGYEMVGAGECSVDTKRNVASFYGESRGYNVHIKPEHLDSIRRLQPEWKIEVEVY